MKKMLATLLLTGLLALASGTAALARGNDSTSVGPGVITPYYQYITLVGAAVDIGSLGRAACDGYVYYTGDYDSTLTIQIQRSNGTGWSTVKSWTESYSGSGYHSAEEVYYVTSGTYRVVTIAKIMNGNTVLETGTSTSSEVTY